MSPALRDRIHALILGAAAAALYLITHQHRFYNDGIFFERKLRVGGEELLYNHILFLPLTRLLQNAVGVVEPIANETAMRSLAALAGGILVAITYSVLRGARLPQRHAVAGAILSAGLTSIWFHSTATELHSVQAACAAVFLLALARIVQAPTAVPDRSTCALLISGACLAPAAHVSGMCVGLPAATVWLLVPPARRRLFFCTGTGTGLFVLAYLWVMSQNAGFAGYTDAHTGKYSVLWTDPAQLPTLLSIGLAEGTLYSLPASTLALAGLRVLFRTQRPLAWLSLAWLGAWPLVAWPVADRMLGAYYTPTTTAQVLLAIAALSAAARSLPRALTLCALSAIPILAVVVAMRRGLDAEWTGGIAWLVAGVTAWFWAGPKQPTRAPNILPKESSTAPTAACWTLAGLAVIVTALLIANVRHLDVERTRIHSVYSAMQRPSNQTGARPLLVYLAENAATDEHWKLFFPGADGDESVAFNPVRLGYVLDPVEATATRERFVATVRAALDRGQPVYLEGSISRAVQACPRKQELQAFFAGLTEFATLAPTTTADLLRIVPR